MGLEDSKAGSDVVIYRGGGAFMGMALNATGQGGTGDGKRPST